MLPYLPQRMNIMASINVQDAANGIKIYFMNSDSIINVNNKGAIYISKNEMINPKLKHIDIRYYYTYELIKQDLADGLTNYYNAISLNKFRKLITHKF